MLFGCGCFLGTFSPLAYGELRMQSVCMPITEDRLKEFIRLYEEETGKGIEIEEAREIASRLVELYMMVAEPLPSELRDKATPPSIRENVLDRTLPEAE